MSTWSRILGSTSLNLAGYIYLLIASLISVPWLAHGLGETRFAAYLLFAALPPALSILDLGFTQAVIRELSRSQGRGIRQTRSTSYAFFLGTAPLVGLITAILAFAVGHTTVGASGYSLGLLFCLVVSVMANHVLNHFLALTQVELRYGVYNVKTWLVGTTNTLGAGLVALVSGDFLLIFVLLTASYLLTLFIVAYSLDRGRYALERPLFDKVTFRGLIRYGLQNFLGTVAGQLEFQGGKYVLSALPPLTVNAFTLPQNIIYKLSGALTTGSLVLFPLSGQMSDPSRRPELRRLYYHVQGLVLIASLAFVALVAIWGQALLTLWLGAGSLATAAYPPLRLLSYFFVLMSLTPVASVVVNALGYPIYTSLSAVATAALNTLLLFIFTPTQGAYGAALAILVSSAVTTPLFLYVTERVLQENKLQY